MPLSHPVPSVVTFHDMIFFTHPQMHTRVKRFFFPWMIRRSSRKADYLITDSENTRRDAIRLLDIPPEKIETVHLGYQDIFRPILDTSRLSAIRDQYQLPKRFILYSGAIEPRKNVPLLLTVFDELVQMGIEQDLVLTGRLGWQYDSVLDQIETMRAHHRVHRVGHVPFDELPVFYNLADVFVYPSVYEGFGLPPLESMACGTPVITSNISSMPEFVGDAVILVPPNDPAALLEAIQRVLSDESFRQRLILDGPKQAANFTWEHTAQKTLAIYERVLSRAAS
jgi:glycosyltransferase involved in cell wall biosynthesis